MVRSRLGLFKSSNRALSQSSIVPIVVIAASACERDLVRRVKSPLNTFGTTLEEEWFLQRQQLSTSIEPSPEQTWARHRHAKQLMQPSGWSCPYASSAPEGLAIVTDRSFSLHAHHELGLSSPPAMPGDLSLLTFKDFSLTATSDIGDGRPKVDTIHHLRPGLSPPTTCKTCSTVVSW